MRPIDADALKEMLKEELDYETAFGFGVAVNLINAAPTIDAMPVVRCKDCKYHGINECFHKLGMIASMDDGFCSYAERRTDETD